MVILQDGEDQRGSLSVLRVYQYREDPPSYAAAYQLDYSKVPLSTGMVLQHRETSKFDVRVDLRQSLASSDVGIHLLYDMLPSSLQLSFGFAGGVNWADVGLLPFVVDASESAWGAVNAGLSVTVLPGRRYRGAAVQVISATVSGLTEVGLSGDGSWFTGAVAEIWAGYRLRDDLELGIGLGYHVRRSLESNGTLLRSMLYFSPSVTFGL
jgi:hypothetical protein